MVRRLLTTILLVSTIWSATNATISVTHDTLLSQIPITAGDSNVSIGGTAVITVDASREFALWTQGAGTRLRYSNSGHTVTFGGLRNLGRIDTIGSTDGLEIKNRNLIAADSDFVCWGAGSIIVSGNASRTAVIRGITVGGVKPTFMYRSTSGDFKLSGCTVSGFRQDFGSGYIGGLNLLPATNRTVSSRDVYFTGVTFDSCAVHIGRTQTLRGFRMDNCLFNLSNTDGFIRTVSPCDTFYRIQIAHNHNGASPSGYGILVDAGGDSAYIYGCRIYATGGSGENTLDRGININAPFVKMDRDTIYNTRFNITTTSGNTRSCQLLNSVLYGASHEQLHWENGTADSNWTVTGNLIYGGGARSLVTVYRSGVSVMKNLNFSYNTVVSTGGGKSAFGWDCPAGTGCGSSATGLVFVGNIFAGANASYAYADMLLDGYTLTFAEFKKNVFDKLDTTRLGNSGDISTPYLITDSNRISSAFGFVDSGASDYRLTGSSPILNCGDSAYFVSIFGNTNPFGDPGYYQSYTTGTCSGSSPTPTGACCYNYTCAVYTEAQCDSIGGVYQGNGTSTCSNCTAPSGGGRLFSHAKFAAITYSGSTQTAANGTWLGLHQDLTINPSSTLYSAALIANPDHKYINYQTLSTLRGSDTTTLRTYATSKGWGADTLIIRANGSVSLEPPQAAGAPCVNGSCTTTVVNGRVVVCQWTTWRNYPDWNKPGAWYFTINKAVTTSGNYGIMEDEAQHNFQQGNLGAAWTDSVSAPENSGVSWPDEGSWCTGTAADAIGWSAYNTSTLRRLRMLELHRTYIPQLVDSMNAHGYKIFSNGAAYQWGKGELIQDFQRYGRSVLYGEGMSIGPIYNNYKATSWEFMDSAGVWGPINGGEAAIATYIGDNATNAAMPEATTAAKLIRQNFHNYCWYMMAANDYTYFYVHGNNSGSTPPMMANDWLIADSLYKWQNVMAVDLGTATGTRTVVQSGTYPVYRRNFQYGSILYRPGAAGADMSDASAVSVALGRTMYRVNYDSSKQAASTSVSIRVGDGAVLVDSTYFNQQSSTGQITVGDASVTEGGTATFTVTLSQAQSVITTFNYATANGTALAGTDYTATSGSKSIPIGSTSTTITVPTTNRTGCQATRAFTVSITGVSPTTITVIDPTGDCGILDDDCGTTYGKTYKGKIVIKGKVKP